jgi:hypothetical protein
MAMQSAKATCVGGGGDRVGPEGERHRGSQDPGDAISVALEGAQPWTAAVKSVSSFAEKSAGLNGFAMKAAPLASGIPSVASASL